MPKRFGVYIPKDLEEGLEKCIKTLEFKSKSKLIQEALRSFVAEYEWMAGGTVSGIIGVIYNHEAPGVDKRLTEIQHEFLDSVVCHVHIHLTREKCMLIIINRGKADRVRCLIRKINSIKGVLLAKPLILAAE